MKGFLRQKKADGIMSRWPTQHLPAWVTVAFWTSWLLVRHTKNCIAIDASADTISTLSGKLGALPGITTKTIYAKAQLCRISKFVRMLQRFQIGKSKNSGGLPESGEPPRFSHTKYQTWYPQHNSLFRICSRFFQCNIKSFRIRFMFYRIVSLTLKSCGDFMRVSLTLFFYI